MKLFKLKNCKFLFVVGLLFLSFNLFSQSALDKNISIEISKQRLDKVLEIISNKGGFYFSYNSNIIKRDSLVSVTANNKTVKAVLNTLFNGSYEFAETGNYIIIKKSPLRIAIVTKQVPTAEKFYNVSGQIVDEQTRTFISNATIYDKQHLISATSNENGEFKIKIKASYKKVTLTVSKADYLDTNIIIEPKFNQQLFVAILPNNYNLQAFKDYALPDSIIVATNNSNEKPFVYKRIDSVEPPVKPVDLNANRRRIDRFLISTKQQVQNLNLKDFFTKRPYQISFTPGSSTHGKLNAQVENKFSLNVLGGYAGGVNGVELGGLFNIDRKNVKYVQAAGLFNLVYGNVKGVQLAGISNTVMQKLSGVQVGGISNYVCDSMNGLQLAGIINTSKNLNGTQIAGIANINSGLISTFQMAGIFNLAKVNNGLQIGLINKARHNNGLQIGLINISDSSNAYAIGLFNFVRKGYNKLVLTTNELTPINVAIKTGTKKLYSIFSAGANLSANNKAYTYGFGLGRENYISKRLALNTELTSQYVYLGNWDDYNGLYKFDMMLNIKIAKRFAFFAGPSINAYYSKPTIPVAGYKSDLRNVGVSKIDFGGSSNFNGWLGYSVGVHVF